ncbi:IS630 transposase-related protein [Suttonella indologenes]|nr:IS630 transposase-related protein [Suttonella indologenes]
MAYSKDYRQMILDKLASGHSYRKLVEEYRLSATTIQRWKKSIERKKYERKPAKIDAEALMADVQAYPDDYCYERAMNGQDALTVATELLP